MKLKVKCYNIQHDDDPECRYCGATEGDVTGEEIEDTEIEIPLDFENLLEIDAVHETIREQLEEDLGHSVGGFETTLIEVT
jgi:hypothetical protein